MTDLDVIVIGGGAAGLSAALVLSRARRTVLLIDSGVPRNAPAAHMHGFLSRDGMPPAELLAIGRDEVTGYGATILDGIVTAVAPSGAAGFCVVLANGDRFTARRLLLATGLHDVLPDIPGLRERWGRDVLHCPYCHGYEVRDQRLAVLSQSPDAVRYAQLIRQWSHDVVFFVPAGILSDTHRAQLAARNIDVVEGDVTRVRIEDDRLRGIEIDDHRFLPCAAVFVPPHLAPNNALLLALGCAIDEDGWVATGPNGHTGVPGVWVAGNLANPRAQVITAAGEGSAAAIAINADLVADDVRDATGRADRGFRPDHPAPAPASNIDERNPMNSQTRSTAAGPVPDFGHRYYVRGTGQHFGPFTLHDLRAMAAAGQLTPTTQVQATDNGQWFEAKEILWLFSDKRWLIAVAISFFLGTLGIDRFYLGYTKIGLAKLFTIGGLGIWALIDCALIALRRVPDSDGLPLR